MRFRALLAPLAALAMLGAAPASDPVDFLLRPELDAAGAFSALSVAVNYSGEADGETEIVLPNKWGGHEQLYKSVRDLSLDGGVLSQTKSPHLRLARHAPGARLTLRYRIVDDANGPPAKDAGGNDYRAIIKPTYFHVLGNALVVRLATTDGETPVRFRLHGMPEGAIFASDLQHAQMGRALTFDDLMESVLVGGDFRVIDAGGGMRLAIRGAWDRRDESWRDGFQGVARAVRAYWRAENEPYLVTVLPITNLPPTHTSIGGTGRSDAFAFFATPNARNDTVDRIMTHEMQHTWIPRRIGGMPQKDEQLDYWLSEGFTDWATMRVMARTERASHAQVVSVLNEWLKDFDTSPVRSSPNSEILAKFWSDPAVQTLPYRRGMLLAHHFDHRVRVATKGAKDFDDVLAWMQARAKRKDRDMTAASLLKKAMRAVAGIDIGPDIARFVERGEVIALPSDMFAPCGVLREIKRPTFHRGFDIEATVANNNIVEGLNVNGPAYAAGMRDGMKLLRRSAGAIGDPDQEIAYDVMDGETPRTFRYWPHGVGEEKFRQLELKPNMGDQEKAVCLGRLGGL
jgi:predicted metalloprotease with PDZ domain